MEETNMRVEAVEYVKLLDELREEAGDTEAALAILNQVGKDRRVRMMSRTNGFNSNSAKNGAGSDRPSEKQLAFARDLGLSVPKSATRQEVSELLDQALAR